jgi:hypothetical protein
VIESQQLLQDQPKHNLSCKPPKHLQQDVSEKMNTYSTRFEPFVDLVDIIVNNEHLQVVVHFLKNSYGDDLFILVSSDQ